MGIWAGKYSGSPVGRLAIFDGNTPPTSSQRGAIRAQTNEFTPTVNYTGGGGGASIDNIALTAPHIIYGSSELLAVGVAARAGDIGHSMFQASAITEPDERFYRKNISGTTFQELYGSSASNEGQLNIWINAEANVLPNAPTSLSPSGSNLLISRTPTLTGNFSDSNETLNNGLAFDKLTRTQVEVRLGSVSGTVIWSGEWANSSGEQTAKKSSIVCGATLNYDTTYYYRVRHTDIIGAYAGTWGTWAGTTFSIKSPNTPPYAPDQLSPTGTISGGLTPVLSMRHRDPDGNNSSMAQQQVIIHSSGASRMDKTWEVVAGNNGTISSTYNGATLAYNTTYAWRGRTMDSQGSWGTWSDWVTFLITSLASVDAPTSPSGWQSSTTPANVVAVYRHNNGKNSNGFKVRLINNVGQVIWTSSSWIAKTVAPNGTVTLTWAEIGYGAVANGTFLTLQVLARDVDNIEATSWSPAVAFNINAAPNVPTPVSPTNGWAGSVRPDLDVTATDPDNGVTQVEIRIHTNEATPLVVGTWNGTLVSGNLYRLLATTYQASMPNYGSYKFSARAYDGYLWSDWSAWRNFEYAEVPSVTISAPAGPTVATAAPVFTWTSATQVAWRMQGWDGARLVYDTGVIENTNKTHTIQIAMYWQGGERWNNGEAFNWIVNVRNSAGLWGASAARTLQLVYVPPTALPVTGTPYQLPQTTQENAMSLNIPQTDVSIGNFQNYHWYRAKVDIEDAIISGTQVHLASVPNIASTAFIDAGVVSGQRYAWWALVEEQRGNDLVYSNPVYFYGSVEWDGVVVHAPYDPLNTALELRWSLGDADYDPESRLVRPMEYVDALNGERIFFMGRKLSRDQHGSFEVVDDEGIATVQDRINTLMHLLKLQGGDIDGIPHVACWRNGRGHAINDAIYGVINPDVSVTQDEDGWYELDITLLESGYVEGVSE